eukprot:GFUD01029892.1.p1 GENE.GFUD01029892.1~~GFUD01029892.1.p1  ORF type:complete len:278 (-),score=57.42 GFUD01029892.1:161-994(-)
MYWLVTILLPTFPTSSITTLRGLLTSFLELSNRQTEATLLLDLEDILFVQPQVAPDLFPRHSQSHKSPQTPAHLLASKPRASPQYPLPKLGAVHLSVPPVTSYPPPPFSPISQFSSPPPTVLKQLQIPPRPDCSCSSKGDVQPAAPAGRMDNRRKESLSEAINDRLRSVSYSSDKFPPASLNLARVSHQDQLPLSPTYSMSGVVPLPANVDTSVPPPSLPTPPPSVSPPLSFNSAKKRGWRTRSPRVSVSEIHDVSTPQPVRASHASNGHIKYVRAD